MIIHLSRIPPVVNTSTLQHLNGILLHSHSGKVSWFRINEILKCQKTLFFFKNQRKNLLVILLYHTLICSGPRPAHSLSNSREHSQPQWKSPAKSLFISKWNSRFCLLKFQFILGSTHPPSSREHLHASAPQWKPPGQSAPWKGQHATPHSPPSSRERGTTPQWKSSTRPSSKG